MPRDPRHLTTSHGVTVISAKDGAEAFAQALVEHPDLILLDYRMPKLDGPAVCAAIRGIPGLCDTYLAIISAEDDPKLRRDADEVAPDAFLPKPIDAEEVIDLLTAALARRAGGKAGAA